ncbi:MAG: type II secretion system F family protein [Bdellovibrionota bacterium]|nr:type II secretion system F family protein [Bdellovibrionota bacterium]
MGSSEMILILSLLLVAFAAYNVVFILLSSSENQELVWDEDNAPNKSKSKFIEISRPLAHFFSIGIAKKITAPNYREKVQKKIKTAGLSREINVDEFIAIQIFWGFVYPLLMSILDFALQMGIPTFFIVGLTAVGAYFPHIHAKTSKDQRYQNVILDMPFFIDLLALATEAGSDFFTAVQKVIEKAEDGSVLAAELELVLRDIRLGRSRTEALRDLAERLDIPEITAFVAMVIDSDQTGQGIGKVLQQQSEQMRLERFTRAEKAGAKASQAMLLPLVIFIMPAIFLMVFGPIGLQMLN